MSDMEALSAMVQELLMTVRSQATDMLQVQSVLENLSRPVIATPSSSAESVGTEVIPSPSITPVVSNQTPPSSTLRGIAKDLPVLTEKNYSMWKAYILTYARAAGDWGKADLPEVFTDSSHPRAVAARDFMWNKCSTTIQRQILQDDVKTAAALWKYLEDEVSETARQSLIALQRDIFNATLLHDESILEYSVRLQELRQQIALGGVVIKDDQLILYLTKDLPARFDRAVDEINVKETTYKEAAAILTRADLLSKSSTSRPNHSALAAHRSAVPQFTQNDDLYCKRCESSGHLASVCQAIQPSPKAYARYEKFLLHFKPEPKFERRDNDEAAKSGIHSFPCTASCTKWILDSGASDHMSPDFESFSEYVPMIPEPVEYGNGATVSAIGTGTITVHTTHGSVTLVRVLYVPTLVANLLSIMKSMNNNIDVFYS